MAKIKLTMWERGLSLVATRVFVRQGKFNPDNGVSLIKILDMLRFTDKEKERYSIRMAVNIGIETGWETAKGGEIELEFEYEEDFSILKTCVKNIPLTDADDLNKLLDLWDKFGIEYKGKDRRNKKVSS